MEQVGNGRYIFDEEDAKKMGRKPKEVDIHSLEGKIFRPEYGGGVDPFSATAELVALALIGLSMAQGDWCGITWHRLFERSRAHGVRVFDIPDVRLIVSWLEEKDFVQVKTLNQWKKWPFRWLNIFCIQVVCPTPKLVELLANVQSPSAIA